MARRLHRLHIPALAFLVVAPEPLDPRLRVGTDAEERRLDLPPTCDARLGSESDRLGSHAARGKTRRSHYPVTLL